MCRAPNVEISGSSVVAYFPASAGAAYLTPDEARCWAAALTRGAMAAEVMAAPVTSSHDLTIDAGAFR